MKTLKGYTLQNGDVVINLGSVFLGNTFSNPNNISTLLFLQLEVSIEDTKMELM